MRNAKTKTTEREARAPSTSPGLSTAIDLSATSVRDLVAILTQIEDTLRSTPFLIPRDGLMVVNPDIAPLLSRQRSIVAQLRARRISWRNGAVDTPRAASASWPRPPWS